jgi:hypothetical protein
MENREWRISATGRGGDRARGGAGIGVTECRGNGARARDRDCKLETVNRKLETPVSKSRPSY